MKNEICTKLPSLTALLTLVITGFATSSPAQAGEKVYFRTVDDVVFWCDQSQLECQMDPVGKLASIIHLTPLLGPESSSKLQDGKSAKSAFDLNVNGRLFEKYVLDLIRFKKVAFDTIVDAENTLNICEDLGLPQAERFICRTIFKKAPRHRQKFAEENECPPYYLRVQGNPDYQTPTAGNDFCVMKYSAKIDSKGRAVSIIDEPPTIVSQLKDAIDACRANGENYHVMTNDEWMTLAREIENTAANWNLGAGPVGSGFLSGGGDQLAGAPAGSDIEPYYLTSTRNNWKQKRTHILSDGSVIWDVGNRTHWTSTQIRSTEASIRIGEKIELTNQLRMRRIFTLYEDKDFLPRGTYAEQQGIGAFFAHANTGYFPYILRGGAGIFRFSVIDSPRRPPDALAFFFRCTYSLP